MCTVFGFSGVLEQREQVGRAGGHSKRGDARREKRGVIAQTCDEQRRSDGVEKEQARTGLPTSGSSEPVVGPEECDGGEEEEGGNPFAEVFSESETGESEG